MKKFITNMFILTLQETSQMGIEVSTPEMEREYEKFAALVFKQSKNCRDLTKHREVLVYTLSVLAGLAKQFQKKDFLFCRDGYFAN